MFMQMRQSIGETKNDSLSDINQSDIKFFGTTKKIYLKIILFVSVKLTLNCSFVLNAEGGLVDLKNEAIKKYFF